VREVKTNQTKAPSAGAPPMTQRKGEVTARMNERDYPHIVELLLPASDLSPREACFPSRARYRAPSWSRQLQFQLIQQTLMLSVIGLAEIG
jgi:hypothetical protein